MDPASATSLAAAILQLASFTGKVLSRSQELYKAADGALLRHTELSSVAKNFQEILQRLEFKKFSSGENVTVKKTALDVLVIEAQAVTQELLVLLRRLTSQPGPNLRWKSVRQAVLTLWKDSQLQELEQRLDRYRNQIDSALTHDLRFVVITTFVS